MSAEERNVAEQGVRDIMSGDVAICSRVSLIGRMILSKRLEAMREFILWAGGKSIPG